MQTLSGVGCEEGDLMSGPLEGEIGRLSLRWCGLGRDVYVLESRRIEWFCDLGEGWA